MHIHTQLKAYEMSDILSGSVVFVITESKKDSKDQESIQSSTTSVPGYQMGKKQNQNKHHKQQPRGQSFPSR